MVRLFSAVMMSVLALQLAAQEEIKLKDGTSVIIYSDGTWQPKTDNGVLKDGRDGQSYKTIVIGKQVWMAENLNYKMPNSWYYDNSQKNESTYGRLYTWEAANKACPSGWHLPNDEEWKELIGNLGGSNLAGKKLKSPDSQWKSNSPKKNETIGFNAKPAGSRQAFSDKYDYMGIFAFFWSSSTDDVKNAWRYYCYFGTDDIIRFKYDKNTAVSVRCVKD